MRRRQHADRATEGVLIIGGGQVGLATAAALVPAGDYRVSVHCRTAEGLARAVAYAESTGLPVATYSYGDLTHDRMPTFLGEPRPMAGGSPVEALVHATGPSIVVDASNMATTLARLDDVAQALRRLSAYTVAAVRAAVEVRARFVKVSTTALGGMGLDIPFSHGDVTGGSLPARMWAKLHLSGAQLQVLWALARTYPAAGIHVLIPATCVGFGADTELLPVPDVAIGTGNGARTAQPRDDRVLTAATARAGEGPTYTRAELTLLAGPASMGAVSDAEVGLAVADLLANDPRRDALRALQRASLGPSSRGNQALVETCDRLAGAESEVGAGMAVTGNLGGHVTTCMLELAAIARAVGEGWLDAVIHDDSTETAGRVATALGRDTWTVAQVCAQGLSLVDAIGPWSFPAAAPGRGTVDLSPASVRTWQEILRDAVDRRLLKGEAAPDWLEALAALLSDAHMRARLRARSRDSHIGAKD